MSDDAIKERFNGIDKELEKHEKRLSSLEKTYQVMEKMEFRMGQLEETVKEIGNKLDEQADNKGKKWDKLIDYLFYFFIATVLSYLALKMGIK